MAKDYFLQFGTGDPRTFTGLAPTFLIFKKPDGTNVTPPAFAEISTSGIYTFNWGTTTPIAFLADAATTSPGTAGRYIAGGLDPADRIDEVGTTLVALGTSNIALGTTNVALGTTNVALGITNVALGITNVAWSVALGSTLVATGSTLVAIGNTGAALGTTNIAFGTTNVALGTTILSLVAINASLTANIGSTASVIGDSATDPATLFGYLKRIRENLEGQQTFNKSTGALTIYERTGATTLATRTVTNNASLVIKS